MLVVGHGRLKAVVLVEDEGAQQLRRRARRDEERCVADLELRERSHLPVEYASGGQGHHCAVDSGVSWLPLEQLEAASCPREPDRRPEHLERDPEWRRPGTLPGLPTSDLLEVASELGQRRELQVVRVAGLARGLRLRLDVAVEEHDRVRVHRTEERLRGEPAAAGGRRCAPRRECAFKSEGPSQMKRAFEGRPAPSVM
eukprot:4121424-Prymnesium_polylepis.1